MRKSLLAAAVMGVSFTASPAMAEETATAAAEPTSPHTVTFNIGLTSNYIFRGTTQTGRRPAIQGGVDYSHASGFYAGTWGSNISWLSDSQVDPNGDGVTESAYSKSSMEWDIYGGYRSQIGDTDFSYDVGVLQYIYPGDSTTGSCMYNDYTTELYAGLAYKWLSGKFSYAPTKSAFGFEGRGATYVDLTATIPVFDTGINALIHVGRQEFGNGPNEFDYTDWKLGGYKSWDNGITVGAYYTDTDIDSAAFTYGTVESGKEAVTAYIQKAF